MSPVHPTGDLLFSDTCEALLGFLMVPSFLSLRKEKKQKKLKPSAEGGEVFPGTSRIAKGPESLKLLASKFVRSRMAPR